MHIAQQHIMGVLKPQDYSARLHFALHFLTMKQVDEYWPSPILWTNVARFHLDGANRTAAYMWSHLYSYVQQQPLLAPFPVTAWCGFTANFILGTYFFEVTINGFVRHTVTVKRYRRLLEYHVVPALRKTGCLTTTIFIQEIATMARCVKYIIQTNFSGECVISHTFPISVPAWSLDLNPCDFWPWCFLKDHFYQGRVANLKDLKSKTYAVPSLY